jgi:hypothetical protein
MKFLILQSLFRDPCSQKKFKNLKNKMRSSDATQNQFVRCIDKQSSRG